MIIEHYVKGYRIMRIYVYNAICYLRLVAKTQYRSPINLRMSLRLLGCSKLENGKFKTKLGKKKVNETNKIKLY